MSSNATIQAATHYVLEPAPKPKPSKSEIRELLAVYYGQLSRDFDEFNSTVSFGNYLSAMNSLIAEQLSEEGRLDYLLSVGSGTGRREIEIRKLSKRQFDITCVDTCAEMCELARRNGLQAVCGTLPELDFPAASFDTCLFLNAFEVLIDRSERETYLRNIFRCLKPGGVLFVDAMDIENRSDAWAAAVQQQFFDANLGEAGYDLGDCFCRRADQDSIVFAHYSHREEMEDLLKSSGFIIESLRYLSEESGDICDAGEGHMFFVARKG